MLHIRSNPTLPSRSDLLARLQSQDLELTPDGYIRWIKASPQHPRSWPAGWKVYNAALVMFLDFFMYAAPEKKKKNSRLPVRSWDARSVAEVEKQKRDWSCGCVSC